MKQAYWNLDLVRLSAEDSAVHIDNEFILIDNLDDAEEEQGDAGWEFVNHPVKLSFTIAIFCVAGRFRVQLNLQPFELCAGDVLIAQEGDIGEYYGMDAGTRVAMIAFAREYFPAGFPVEPTMTLQRQLRAMPVCRLAAEAMRESLAIYRLMKAKAGEAGNPFRRGALTGYMQVLTCNACRYLLSPVSSAGEPRTKSSREQKLYTRFVDEVRKEYVRQRSIGYYAGRLCVTPKYLSQVVHRASGRFAGEWIADFVILEAKALLKSRKYAIQQVADMLNFANQSFFGKYFKKHVGCSPSEYQRGW